MSLLRRLEQVHKGTAAQHDGTATPVLRPSLSSTQILAREDLLHGIRLRLQGEIGNVSTSLTGLSPTRHAPDSRKDSLRTHHARKASISRVL